MALSNHERVGKALEVLKAGLPAFVERELKNAHGAKWLATAKQVSGRPYKSAARKSRRIGTRPDCCG